MVLSKSEKKAKNNTQQQKLELLKATEDAKKEQKKDELTRELAAHSASRKILDKKWDDAMVRIKEPVFRKEIEAMRNTFERAFDKKYHLIDIIMQFRQVADDQHQRAICGFCDKVDSMISKLLSDLEETGKVNDIDTAKLLQLGKQEMNDISKNNKKDETHLQMLLYNAIEKADNNSWIKRGESLVKRDEDTNKRLEIRDNLRTLLENKFYFLWEQYIATLKTYISHTSENQRHIRRLRRKQNKIADVIAVQAKKMISNESVIKRLRTELASYESGSKQAAFRSRRTRHRNACSRLKDSLRNATNVDVKQLALLVKASDDSVDRLDTANKKVEKILRMAALCRKFETEREKILPFGLKPPNTLTAAKTCVRQKHEDPIIADTISSTCGMTRLWHRISEAELCNKALYHEKRLLEQENAQMVRDLNNRKEDKVTLNAFQSPCSCVQKSSTKSLLRHPHAVEGRLEAKKYIGFL